MSKMENEPEKKSGRKGAASCEVRYVWEVFSEACLDLGLSNSQAVEVAASVVALTFLNATPHSSYDDKARSAGNVGDYVRDTIIENVKAGENDE